MYKMNKNVEHRRKANEHKGSRKTKKTVLKKTLPSNDYENGLFVKIKCGGSRKKTGRGKGDKTELGKGMVGPTEPRRGKNSTLSALLGRG